MIGTVKTMEGSSDSEPAKDQIDRNESNKGESDSEDAETSSPVKQNEAEGETQNIVTLVTKTVESTFDKLADNLWQKFQALHEDSMSARGRSPCKDKEVRRKRRHSSPERDTRAGAEISRPPAPGRRQGKSPERDETSPSPHRHPKRRTDAESGTGHRKRARKQSCSDEGEITDDDPDAISINGDDDDELWREIEADLQVDEKEKTCTKVAKSLAGVANKRFSTKIADERVKDTFDKISRPENCEKLVVPSVNPEIWRKIPARSRTSDLRFVTTQRAVVKAATAIVHTTQMVIRAAREGKPVDKALKTSVTDMHADALLLLGHVSSDLSMRRRSAIRPHLNRDLTGLCSDLVPVTSKLFGDDLAASMREVRAADKVAAAVAGPSGWHDKKFKAGQNQDKRPFLDQHRPQWKNSGYQKYQKHFGGKQGAKAHNRK